MTVKNPLTVNKNSRWFSNDYQEFRVIDTADIEGKTWVYYVKVQGGETYSCWLESFLARFTENSNQ
jgi:hypothetical protein